MTTLPTIYIAAHYCALLLSHYCPLFLYGAHPRGALRTATSASTPFQERSLWREAREGMNSYLWWWLWSRVGWGGHSRAVGEGTEGLGFDSIPRVL